MAATKTATKAKEAEATDVALVESNDAVPAYLRKANAPVILEDNFDTNDAVVPQIKLLQGTSEQCTLFDNAKPGIFWHTGFDMPLGTEFEFIVIRRRKKYLLLAPLTDGGGVFARSDDAKKWDRLGSWDVKIDKKRTVRWTIDTADVERSSVVQWGSQDPDDDNSPPAATLFYDYVVILPKHMDCGAAVMSLARSAIRVARKGLNDKIALHANAGRPMQALKFKATAKADQNDDGQDFYNWHFTGAGFADEELFAYANKLAEAFKDFVVQDEEKTLDAEPVVDFNDDVVPY